MIAMGLSKKSQRELLLIVMLLGVFALTLSGAFKNAGIFTSRASGPVMGTTSRAQQAAPPTTIPAQAPVVNPVRNPFSNGVKPADQARYTAFDLRDPLQSLLPEPRGPEAARPQESRTVSARAPSLPPSLRLEGVVWGGAVPQAIIGQGVYGVGDAVEGATIKSIGRDGITVEFQGQTMHVAVQQGAVKDTVSRASPRRPK